MRASKLPTVGTTIFTTMSALAAQTGAINLGQGFPDFACDPQLLQAVQRAMQAGHNQYPPMAGVPQLRHAITNKIQQDYGAQYDPEHEITVTAGATQAVYTAIQAFVHAGDEVIVLDPCFDSYEPGILLAGGVPRHVPLTRDSFRPDFAAIAAAIQPRTSLIIINTPHNPSGSIWSAEEMQQLSDLLAGTDIVVIADEVYEYMVYDQALHQSAARFAELRQRCVLVSSFGKTYHVTGWKVGYAAAPKALMQEFRKVHQFNVFTVNSAMQYGIAEYMTQSDSHHQLASFYQQKRDLFRSGLANSKLRLLPCSGSYFQTVDYSAVSDLDENEFCLWLTREVGVAAIPISAFYADHRNQSLARFCFAKREETLQQALARLAQL